MIDVAELRKLRANEFRRMNDIEEIFDALVVYPEGQGFHNATRADLVGALHTATESLVGDTSEMPAPTRLAISSVAGTARADLPPGDGVSYGWGAAAVDQLIDAFEARLTT